MVGGGSLAVCLAEDGESDFQPASQQRLCLVDIVRHTVIDEDRQVREGRGELRALRAELRLADRDCASVQHLDEHLHLGCALGPVTAATADGLAQEVGEIVVAGGDLVVTAAKQTTAYGHRVREDDLRGSRLVLHIEGDAKHVEGLGAKLVMCRLGRAAHAGVGEETKQRLLVSSLLRTRRLRRFLRRRGAGARVANGWRRATHIDAIGERKHARL